MRPASAAAVIPECILFAVGIILYYIGETRIQTDANTHVIYPLLSNWGSGIAVLVVPIAFVSTLFFATKSNHTNLVLLYCGAVVFVLSQWVMMSNTTDPMIAQPGFFLSGCGFGILYSAGVSVMWHWVTGERQPQTLLAPASQDAPPRQLPTFEHHPRSALQH